MFEDFDPANSKRTKERDKLLEKFAVYLAERAQAMPTSLRELVDEPWLMEQIDDLLDEEEWTAPDMAKLAALFLLALALPEGNE